jgi:hypothetical protein
MRARYRKEWSLSSITRDYFVIGRSEIDAMVEQKLADIVMSGHSKNDKARDLAALVARDATIEVFRCISEMIPVVVSNVVDDGWKKLEGNPLL